MIAVALLFFFSEYFLQPDNKDKFNNVKYRSAVTDIHTYLRSHMVTSLRHPLNVNRNYMTSDMTSLSHWCMFDIVAVRHIRLRPVTLSVTLSVTSPRTMSGRSLL